MAGTPIGRRIPGDVAMMAVERAPVAAVARPKSISDAGETKRLPDAPSGLYGRAQQARASLKKMLARRPAFMGGRVFETDSSRGRLADFMASEMTALNASGTVRYSKAPNERLRLAGQLPETTVLSDYRRGPGNVVPSARTWPGIDAETLARPGSQSDPAILECGSVLSIIENRFFLREVERRGGNFATFERMLERNRVEVTTNPETKASPLVTFYALEYFAEGAIDEKSAREVVRRGDLVYIQGDPAYSTRFSGPNQGWHLACVGENEAGEPLFVGFSSQMTRAFTYAEMRELMLEEYAPAERERITIGGVRTIRRFDQAMFEDALARAKAPPAVVSSSDRVAPENMQASLEAFEVRDADDARLLKGAQDFLAEVRRHPEKSHVLHLQGRPGRGKTHLALALMRALGEQGKTTSFLAPRQVGDRYNMLLTADAVRGEKAFWKDITKRIAADVVVLDDMNEGYGIGPDIAQQTLDAAGKTTKVVIITGNVLPKNDTPGAKALDLASWAAADPTRRAQASVLGITGVSRRNEGAWTTATELARMSNDQKLAALATAKPSEASPSAGVVVTTRASDVAKVMKAANAKLSVRCAGPAYVDRKVTSDSDFRTEESRGSDVIVVDTSVHTCLYGAIMQLTALAERIFSQPRKKAVLCISVPLAELKAELARYYELNNACGDYSDHIANRVATVFPELA